MKLPPCNDSGNCVEADASQRVMLYTTLYTVALGGGSIKSNVSGFESDFDKSDPKEEKAMVYFFNRFYFCVSLVSLFAATTYLDSIDYKIPAIERHLEEIHVTWALFWKKRDESELLHKRRLEE
nr:protein NRT1/ PTR FAMILY 6.4-like [Tanacetum cinerariifolium]